MKRSMKIMSATFALGVLMCGALACGAGSQSVGEEVEERAASKPAALKQYTSAADGFSTSSFWVEGDQADQVRR